MSASPTKAGTYWFTLSNALSQNETGVNWDQNGGQSQAFVRGFPGEVGSESFQLFNAFASGPVVPEPAGLTLVCASAAGAALRRWQKGRRA